MAWEPAVAAVDVRRVAPNLKTFFDDRREELGAWAGVSGADWAFYPSAESRIKTDFPHTGVVRRRVASERRDDGHHVRVELTFETEVAGDHTKDGRTAAIAALQHEADSRCLALESMVLNMSAAELYDGVPRRRGDFRDVTTQDPLEVAVSDTRSMFNVQQQVVLRFIVSHRD